MKRYQRLFDEICSFENLFYAANKAQQGKRCRKPVAEFNLNLEHELLRLHEDLQAQTYSPGPFRQFQICDPKTRIISAAPYRDRVVHHALCNILEPIFERSFIYDSYACRRDKGTHAAVDRLSQFMQSSKYVLKCDIQKYFPSVDHSILKELVRRKIGCKQTLWLLDLIIDHSPKPDTDPSYFSGDDLFTPFERRRGLPVGNQTSQFLANVYLNLMDHMLKEQLGCRHYIRYVDDFVVLANDKETLWEVRDKIEEYLANHLRLRLHPIKQTVSPACVGIDFLGYRVFPTHRLLRRTSGYKFARGIRAMQVDYKNSHIGLDIVRARVAGWIGHARHADTYGLRTALLSQVVFSRA